MTDPTALHWDRMYRQIPLQEVPRHFAGIRQSPFLLQYLTQVLSLCPPGSRTCETGIGSGYGAIWLSLRGVQAEGIDYSPGIVERAHQVNNILGGNARFRVGDLFQFYRKDAPRYSVVHHQGVLEHFTLPQIQAALAQQVAMSDWVVFSVPSVYYPFDGEFGDERLLPLFNARLHSGAQVDGRVIAFPADNPDLALIHYSYESVGHHLEKLNRYTDGEAASMHQDGCPFHWQIEAAASKPAGEYRRDPLPRNRSSTDRISVQTASGSHPRNSIPRRNMATLRRKAGTEVGHSHSHSKR